MSLQPGLTPNSHTVLLNDEPVDVTYGSVLEPVAMPVIKRMVHLLVNSGATVDDIVVNAKSLGYYYDGKQYIDANGNGVLEWDIDEDVTLEPKYEESVVKLPKIKRNHYSFVGWRTTDGEIINDTLSFANTSMSLTAVFEPNAYTVTYDYKTNGGTACDCETKDVVYKDSIDLSVAAEKEDSTFIGWNTDKDADVGLKSVVMEGEPVTLYAIYAENVPKCAGVSDKMDSKYKAKAKVKTISNGKSAKVNVNTVTKLKTRTISGSSPVSKHHTTGSSHMDVATGVRNYLIYFVGALLLVLIALAACFINRRHFVHKNKR